MAHSPETLRFAKQSVTNARVHSEQLVAEMAPNLEKLTTPVEQRIIELRGFIRGKISGQNDVLDNVRKVVPAEKMAALQANAERVTAPASYWNEKFEQSLSSVINGDPKSQERAKKFLAELAERVRTLVVWEGILDQLIAQAAPAPVKPMPKPAAKPAPKNASEEIDLAPQRQPADGDTGDFTQAVGGGKDEGELTFAPTVDDGPLDDAAIANMLKNLDDDDEIIGGPASVSKSVSAPAKAAVPAPKPVTPPTKPAAKK
jgi:hypothetical protein